MKVLAIGAHPDDIEVGCGGALAIHHSRGDRVAMLVMTTGERGPQASRSRVLEQEEAAAQLGARLYWGEFEDGSVPEGPATVDAIQAVLAQVGADTVYTHSPNDTHQDHRMTALASMAATRRLSRVLLYESPTTTAFGPTVLVDIGAHLDAKVGLVRAHLSQVLKNGLIDLEAIEAQARYRGFLARVRHAEGFESGRFLWSLRPAVREATVVADAVADLSLTGGDR